MDVGRTQTLRVQAEVPGGYRVGDDRGTALMPTRLAPPDVRVGQDLTLFVYPDRDGTLLATPERPHVERGGFACLEVVDVAPQGAYLDWGLERDLLVPGQLQHRPLAVGDRVVVAVDVDPSGRVYASSQLVPYLVPCTTLEPGDAVDLLVFGFNEVGALAVVDGRFHGLLYRSETFRPVVIGEATTGWVKGVRDDGRLDVTLHRTARAGTLDAVGVIWQRLVDGGGFLALTDRSDPREIHRQLEMSKKAFKKAVGALYKERRITLEDGGIRMVR